MFLTEQLFEVFKSIYCAIEIYLIDQVVCHFYLVELWLGLGFFLFLGLGFAAY